MQHEGNHSDWLVLHSIDDFNYVGFKCVCVCVCVRVCVCLGASKGIMLCVVP